MIARPYPEILDVSIREAVGKTLAEDIFATEDIPNKPEATMDGYAVRISDLGDSRGRLKICKESLSLPHRGAVHVSNGGRMPKGTDTVVRIEETDLRKDEIEIRGPVKVGDYVRERGSEARAGQTILYRGTRIDFPLIGILGILGRNSALVYNKMFNGCYFETPSNIFIHDLVSTWGRKASSFGSDGCSTRTVVANAPRVAIFSTGNEIIPLGKRKMAGQVYEKNSYVLGAMVEERGGIPVYGGILPDDTGTIVTACLDALRYTDFVLISGGTSVGRLDKINSVFYHLRDKLGFTIKNSSTIPERAQFACLNRKGIWALPGRIVRAIQIFIIEVWPTLNTLAGRKQPGFDPSRLLRARLIRNEPWNGQSSSPFVRIVKKRGVNFAIPLPFYREFTCLLHMNAIVVSPKNGKGIVPGDVVVSYPLYGDTPCTP
ncbi:MAG: molybdopterin molybdotransferase MoeA [Candidatus Hodarchaeota archaeon]